MIGELFSSLKALLTTARLRGIVSHVNVIPLNPGDSRGTKGQSLWHTCPQGRHEGPLLRRQCHTKTAGWRQRVSLRNVPVRSGRERREDDADDGKTE